MLFEQTLGVPAHPGGLLVDDPALTVGVVQMTSRNDGLEIDLVARRGQPAPPAERRLLPAYDEGVDLRVGWLDANGRAHWEYGSIADDGSTHRTRVVLPAQFDRLDLVLAWPEIGFPEHSSSFAVPSRAEAERGVVSIWEAPVDMAPVPGGVRDSEGDDDLEPPPLEAGRLCAAPRVLARDRDGVVVLSRLTAVGSTLAMAVESFARIAADAPGDWGASIAVLRDRSAVRLAAYEGEAGGGADGYHARTEYVVARPSGDVLDLVVRWPAAGLAGVRVTVPLEDAVSR
ncbi:hypothetical protein KOI35_19075 [Actinoplanes bogorensis]|uniref:Uncharacterized protein n=1 Tax=Paractinoplanes bogorensis TaxID=1610840 RepID=A0ABS5YQ95_9ACTN|nr:hypothetical protein [Actinoplanes bogorensis]MBU2665617.1 hypothetical protein [Actinoplanes bogorensis]